MTNAMATACPAESCSPYPGGIVIPARALPAVISERISSPEPTSYTTLK